MTVRIPMRRINGLRAVRCLVLLFGLLVAGCPTNPTTGGDAAMDAIAAMDAQGSNSCYAVVTLSDGGMPTGLPGTSCLSAGFVPAPLAPFTANTDTPGTLQVTVSGEALAEQGYPFTQTPATGQTVFVDSWSLYFDSYIVVLDHVRLNQPGPDPAMQNSVGATVAQQDGPWAVNVHAHGIINGKGGLPETAIPLLVFAGETSGSAFDPGVRYAFSFDTVPATYGAHNVNLAAADVADLTLMIQHHWTKYFRGHATHARHSTSEPAAFQNYPTVVDFAFGVADPASYVNCANPDYMTGPGCSADGCRGVQLLAGGQYTAQITMHTDHFFWDQTDIEGTPLHFDPMAARVQGFGSDPFVSHNVTLADLAGDNPAMLQDALGGAVADRSDPMLAVGDTYPPPSYRVGNQAAGAGVRDLRDFATYNGRSQAHLNSNGLCFVQPTGPITY